MQKPQLTEAELQVSLLAPDPFLQIASTSSTLNSQGRTLPDCYIISVCLNFQTWLYMSCLTEPPIGRARASCSHRRIQVMSCAKLYCWAWQHSVYDHCRLQAVAGQAALQAIVKETRSPSRHTGSGNEEGVFVQLISAQCTRPGCALSYANASDILTSDCHSGWHAAKEILSNHYERAGSP